MAEQDKKETAASTATRRRRSTGAKKNSTTQSTAKKGSRSKKTSSSKNTSNSKKTSGSKNTSRSRNINSSKSASRAKNREQERNLPTRQTDLPAEDEINMGIELQLILSLGLMILLFLSNFGLCGTAGRILSSFFFGLFGCVQYVMPVAFFLGLSLLLVNDYSLLALKKCLAGFLILMMISAAVQLFAQSADVTVYEVFSIALTDKMTGGLLGGGLACILRRWFGLVGACIILLCIFILSCIMLTQKSMADFFKRSVADVRTMMGERAAEHKERPAGLRRRFRSPQEKERDRQCEEKVRVLEEEKKESGRKRRSAVRSSEKAQDKEDGMRVPTFRSSDEVKRKDSVRELYADVYPFTQEDGRGERFEKELDFSAFSFKENPPSEDFSQSLQEQLLVRAEMDRRLRDGSSIRTRGAREIAGDFGELSTAEAMGSDAGYPEIPYPEETVDAEPVLDVTDYEELPWEEDPDPIDQGQEEAFRPEEQTGVSAVVDSRQRREPAAVDSRQNRKSRTVDRASSTVDKESGVTPVSVDKASDIRSAVMDKDSKVVSKASTGLAAEGYQPTEAEDIVIHKEEKTSQKSEGDSSVKYAKPYSKKAAEGEDYVFPPLNLLAAAEEKGQQNYDSTLRATAQKLQETLHSFGVNVKMTDISFGPAVTRYEMVPEQGTKVSKIVSLTDDIKLSLAAQDIRIEAPIPGKSAIGIEVPNKQVMTVHFRELIDSSKFRNFRSRLAFAVGKDIGGQTVISDIAKMPHLLIAGATGSGKSVCINTLIMSILYKARPDEVKLIMIDPKMVELSIYNGIPHLLIPVVTDPKKASGALNWAVAEMTDRYNKFTTYGVRNMEGYNEKVRSLIEEGEVDPAKLKPLPQIVVIIDELADLMMVASGEVEDAIVRLSQLARAAGIHLVIATQRPSVNVITGLIKANVPSRIAFAVSSGVDSRTIIDMNGAEKLLGKGDMLFFPAGSSKPSRVQGAFISDDEIFSVVEFLKENEQTAVYDQDISESIEKKIVNQESSQDRDEYFADAARFLMEKEKGSIGMLQRMFKIGFNRAARIMDQLAEAGIVGPEEGTKPRKILMSPEQLEQYLEEYY